jgi:hypothetical protein
MELLSPDVIKLLWFLLPGFLAIWVFEGLIYRPQPTPFRLLMEALIFTLFAKVLLIWLEAILIWSSDFCSLGQWTDSVRLIWSVFVGITLGLVFSYCTFNDSIHRVLRKMNITTKGALSSVWYSLMCKNSKERRNVILHFREKNRPRLYGFPDEWDDDPESGFIALSNATWVSDNNDQVNLQQTEYVVVAMKDVLVVEHMKNLDESGKQEPESLSLNHKEQSEAMNERREKKH